MTSPLPTLDECEVKLATYEQQVEMWECSRPHFAPSINSNEYKKLCDLAQGASYSQPNRWRGWVLVKRGDPHSPVYTYAETLLRDGWAKDNDGMRAAAIYGVTYVITPQQYRRQGYCHRLLQTLHYLLASPANIGPYPSSWSPLPPRPKKSFPPADVCYLSSAAPKGFYESCYIGPDEDRPGWCTRDNTENSQLVWDASKFDTPSEGEVKYDLVYQKDIDGLADEIAKAHLKILEDTPVKQGEVVLRIIPNSPVGALLYTDIHWVVGCDAKRSLISAETVIGIRLAPTSQLANSKAATSDSTQPLVLFIPHGRVKGELMVLLLLNVDSTNLTRTAQALKEVGATLDPPCGQVRFWGLEEDGEVVTGLKEYGAEFSYRSETHFIPHGVAWYGPKGTECRLDGLEAWAWI